MRYALIIFFAVILPSFAYSSASSLFITNKSGQTILNILVEPEQKINRAPFFIRLDLEKDKTETVDNPGYIASLRVDTGLDLCFFSNIDLQTAAGLVFCGEHAACLVILNNKKEETHQKGKTLSLLSANDKPCELSRFSPSMKMADVCNILDKNLPKDDNGSILTSLHFGGLLWAGRLAPNNAEPANAGSVLEHIELRRPFSADDLNTLLQFLKKQGYVIWEAEFPDIEITFAANAKTHEKMLNDALKNYLANIKAQPKEAVLMFAPAQMIDVLNNADAPQKDVQLFTLSILPASGQLLLDMAAYTVDN